MRAAAHTTIENDLDLAIHGLDNLRQLVEGRAAAVELASAMVGYNHTIDTVRHRFCGVFWVEDALKN